MKQALPEVFGERIEIDGGHLDVAAGEYALTPLENGDVAEAFCPTGEGGGIDNSCSSRDGRSVARSVASLIGVKVSSWDDVAKPGVWFRVQPKGKGLDHQSETSNGELSSGVHVMANLASAVSQEGIDRMLDGSHELVVIDGPEKLRDTEDVEGWVLPKGKGKIIGRFDIESLHEAYKENRKSIASESAEIDLTPPESVRSNAKRGLELREKNGGKGGTVVGVARARDLANGANLSPRTIGRMVSFFARHQGNQEGGVDDEGRIAWLLWGGDAGKRWANARWEEIQRARG